MVSQTEKLRIMIVDDEADIAEVLGRGLTNQGHSVSFFTQPIEALEAYKQKNNEFDVVISDIRMPDMDGFKLARSLWKITPNQQICFMSSFEIHSNEAKTMFPTLNSHCFLSKPIRPTMLAAHVQKHFASTLFNENSASPR